MPSDDASADTIAAIASPPGRGGVGVLRISGPRVPHIAHRLAGGLPEPRRACLRDFKDTSGERVDQGLVIYFPAPRSYTGEPVLELQGHGGPVVMGALLSAALDAGARLAEPGEFTRRAFLNGRLDLAQAESVADLIDAASREAARSAVRSLRGEFSSAIDALIAQVTELRALVEAMLDFPEEEVDRLHRDDALDRLRGAQRSLEDVLSRSRQGSLLRSGVHVVLAGRPNVGKSSLLNRLAGEDRAIVTDIPGTTRDAIREPIQIEGVPLVVVDTAGLRASEDPVEQMGVARTRREIGQADLVLAIRAADLPDDPTEELPGGAEVLHVVNKADLRPGREGADEKGRIWVSAKTGAGLAALRAAILRTAGWSSTGESAFLARERHLRALDAARRHLEAAGEQSGAWEFFAEELRKSQDALGEITGRITADDLLGEIFSRFCIGK